MLLLIDYYRSLLFSMLRQTTICKICHPRYTNGRSLILADTIGRIEKKISVCALLGAVTLCHKQCARHTVSDTGLYLGLLKRRTGAHAK